MTRVPPKNPVPGAFDRAGISGEGNVVPSRVAAILNHYGSTHGSPYRFTYSDVIELHRSGFLPEGIPTPEGRFRFDSLGILAWLDQGKLDGAIEHLVSIEDSRAQISRQGIEQSEIRECEIEDRAGDICLGIAAGSSFEQDLQAAVSAVVRKHYERIPNTVARMIAAEMQGNVRLSEAADAYGREFTGKILDRLADSWVKRILGNGRSCVDREKITEALGRVTGLDRSGSVIYVVKASGLRAVKIGIARSLQSRIGGIQTGSPFPVKCLLAFPGNTDCEQALHYIFRETRLCGEWFVLDSTMKQFILDARSKINGLLQSVSTKSGLARAQRHIDAMRKLEPEDDELSSVFGMSMKDAWQMARQISSAPENI